MPPLKHRSQIKLKKLREREREINTETMGAAGHGLYRRLWAVRACSAHWCALIRSWMTPLTTGNIQIERGGKPIQYNQPWIFLQLGGGAAAAAARWQRTAQLQRQLGGGAAAVAARRRRGGSAAVASASAAVVAAGHRRQLGGGAAAAAAVAAAR